MYSKRRLMPSEIKSVQTVHHAGMKIEAQASILQWRFPFGGFVWSRPIAVLVESETGVKAMPVRDVSRLAVLAIVGTFALLLIVLISLLGITGAGRQATVQRPILQVRSRRTHHE